MHPEECDSSTEARIRRRTMGREREARKTVGNARVLISRCSSTTTHRNTVSRAELGMRPHEIKTET